MKKIKIKLINNPLILARKGVKGVYMQENVPRSYKKPRYLFDYDSHQLLKSFKNRRQAINFLPLKSKTVDWFFTKKRVFDWEGRRVFLTSQKSPNFQLYQLKQKTGPKSLPKVLEPKSNPKGQRAWNAFKEDRAKLDSVDRSIPFFHSVGGVSSIWKKPQFVLDEEEAKDNGLEPFLIGSNIYLSNKHVMYIKQNDLYYKIDMVF